MCGSWGKSGRVHLGVPGISLSQLSLEGALPPKLGVALAPSVQSCGPILSQPPQTCWATTFSSNEIDSWQAGNGCGIRGEVLFPTIVFSSHKNPNWLKWEKLASSLWLDDSITEKLLGEVITNAV
jgi:hypothetical protein